MASVSRLPSVRRQAGDDGSAARRRRPMSMIEGPASNLYLDTQATVVPEADASKKAKRRSLLPQFNRKASGDGKADLDIKEEDENEQHDSSRPSSKDARDLGESAGRRAIDVDRPNMPPPSKRSRPPSMIPPRGASQFAGMKPGVAHSRQIPKDQDVDTDAARAEALDALTGSTPATPSKLAMPASGLKRASSTRLPHSHSVSGPIIPSRTTSNQTSHAQGRISSGITGNRAPTTTAEKRSSAARPRPPSQPDQAPEHVARISPPRSSVISRARPNSQMLQQTSPQRAPAGSRTRPVSQMPPPTMRPNFNTYQQHYSPVKSALPKAPLPPSKAVKPAATADSDLAMTFDITMQQIELLQLSLLHQASNKCMREYTTSAKQKLGRKHTRLRKDYEGLRATELVHQRIINLSALEAWCRDPGLLVENLQILSLVYSDLTALMEEGSRHGDVVSIFELWMNDAEAPESGTFVQPLPDDWKAAHASLSLKLRSIQRNLGVLPPAHASGEEGAAIEMVLKSCKTLVDGMLKELEVMVRLEKELLAREKTRIEEEVKALVLDDVGMQSIWVPAWQKV
ncbi:hypothetical protein LTR37_004313 [Vermiconidia calcicola]|uniref:Uncharacterized protein n=1 Tax=Vermiconidia calcicola TaxID=1690605 RepID=A0ACC3NMK7_9PEZI|nr:hypothetical protein LTR37_004313 [Vermiconidia calcicola]